MGIETILTLSVAGAILAIALVLNGLARLALAFYRFLMGGEWPRRRVPRVRVRTAPRAAGARLRAVVGAAAARLSGLSGGAAALSATAWAAVQRAGRIGADGASLLWSCIAIVALTLYRGAGLVAGSVADGSRRHVPVAARRSIDAITEARRWGPRVAGRNQELRDAARRTAPGVARGLSRARAGARTHVIEPVLATGQVAAAAVARLVSGDVRQAVDGAGDRMWERWSEHTLALGDPDALELTSPAYRRSQGKRAATRPAGDRRERPSHRSGRGRAKALPHL